MRTLSSSLRYFTGFKVDHSIEGSTSLLISSMGERISASSMRTILAGDCPELPSSGELRGAVASILSACKSIDSLNAGPSTRNQALRSELSPARDTETLDMPDFLSGYSPGMH